MDLAYDPLLDAVNELGGRDFGSAAVNQPGVGEPWGLLAQFVIYPAVYTYRPADIVGQVVSLQME